VSNALFYGCGTALVTPFRGNRVDYDALERLIDWQLESNVDALVVLGTTGEPASVSAPERAGIIECARARYDRRVPLIVGTGSNDTRTAVRQSVEAQRLGADALLVVTPYYNKASASGLAAHFNAVADAVDLPVIMYNVPGRTGLNLAPRLAAELARHPNLQGIKEASESLRQLTELAAACGGGMAIYCGNDAQVVPAMALGARGVISVASNVIPREMGDMVRLALAGDFTSARAVHDRYYPLFHDLFIDVNPVMAKEALWLMGLVEREFRLPLCETTDENLARMKATLKAVGIPLR